MGKEGNLTAVIFGGSGLTGRFLKELLLKDSRYEKLILFVRKEMPAYHGKIRQVVFDPDKISEIESEITGNQVFCCIGSTIKKAGSKDVFFKIDHDLVINIAKAAFKNQIPVFTVISSIGAKANTSNFYLNTKGLMEENLKSIGFKNLNILRPSMLLGLRSERRMMEETGKVVMKALGFLFIGKLKKYKPIHAETVARAMIKAANSNNGNIILESDKIQVLGNID
ncbi:MAG: NAD(P)H-binding protein [Lentimicrobium sp.]|nr:NAD(P)H-binding protein [Lentimicrobium sp.]